MQKVKDRNGDEWTFQLDIPLIERIKDELGYNFLNPLNVSEDEPEPKGPSVFENLKRPEPMINLLWFVCQDQCKERGIDDLEFGKLWRIGDYLVATKAFFVELTDFFQGSPLGEIFRDALKHSETMAGKIDEGMAMVLEQVNKTQDAKLHELETALAAGRASGGLPALSESTPAPQD